MTSKQLLSEQALNDQVDSLPNELSPERDLWSGIEKAISHQSQDTVDRSADKLGQKIPLAWAASVVAAVLLTWGVYKPQNGAEPSGQVNVNLVAAMEQSFEHQKQTMLVSFGQPKLQELPAEMQTELKQLASAQATIKKALESDENNVDLLNLLRWTQQQELDFIKQLYSPQWQSI